MSHASAAEGAASDQQQVRAPGPMRPSGPVVPRSVDITNPLADERHRRCVAEMVVTASYPELDAVLGRWPAEAAHGDVAVYGILQVSGWKLGSGMTA